MKKLFTIAALLGLAAMINAQTLITGSVTDVNGAPLPGTNVIIYGLGLGTSADANGWYQIEKVSAGEYIIQATFVGYEELQQKLTVLEGTNQQTVHLQLKERAIQMDALTVWATRADAKTPMTYTNLDKETIEKNNLGQDVPYLLRWTPSAVVTSDAGTGIGYTGIRIRGTDPTRINVTINGIPLNDAESQGVFWVDLPDFVSSTNDIQVQRGVGTSTNGAGAFGASINLNTSQLHKEAYGKLNASIGSFNTLKGNIEFGSGLLGNKFTFDGRISRINSDGYIDRASVDLESFYLSAAYLGKKSSLRLNAFSGHEVTYQAWWGVPPALLGDPETRTFNPAGMEKEGTPYDNEVDDYQQNHYQVLFNRALSTHWHLNLALHYTRGAGFFEQYKAGEAFEDYGFAPVQTGNEIINTTDLIRRRWLDNDFYGTTYSLQYISHDNKLETTIGGAYNIYEGQHFGEVIWARFAGNSEIRDRYYDNDARKTDFNIFTKFNYEILSDLNAYVDLQFRRVGYDFLGFNNDLQNIEQSDMLNFFNPKAGLLFQLNPNANLYASFGVANREPNRSDYTENPTATRPKQERLYNTELGYRQNWEKAGLGVHVYHMYYRDQLALNGQVNDVGEYMRINIDKSYRLGLELVGGIEMGSRFELNLNATISQNKVNNFLEFVDVYDADFNWLGQEQFERTNTDLAFSPALIAGGELAYDVFKHAKKTNNQMLNLALLGKYVGKQYIDNTSDESNVIDAYFFSDFRIRYVWKTKWVKEIGLTFLARNIFDSLFETNAWSYRYVFDGTTAIDQGYFPQAGRNFLLGVSLGF